MQKADVIRGWGRIVSGYAPNLSIEITRECPLRCPGCYAYGETHLGGGVTLRELRDLKGPALVDGVMRIVKQQRPVHLSIVGGEPLVRYRELGEILPQLPGLGVHTQLVTSAVRPIPEAWASIPRLSLVVSIDGLQPEHDARRRPATYDRILKHIAGHRVTVHCTVTRQQAQRDGYLEAFARFWSAQPAVKRIWFSLYTPQVGEFSPECLTDEDRAKVVAEIRALRPRFPLIEAPDALLDGYLKPPASPSACIFARTTLSLSADLQTKIEPCQLGGRPDCGNCGCVATAALEAVGRHRLPGGVRVGAIFEASIRVGAAVRAVRDLVGRRPEPWALPPQPAGLEPER